MLRRAKKKRTLPPPILPLLVLFFFLSFVARGERKEQMKMLSYGFFFFFFGFLFAGKRLETGRSVGLGPENHTLRPVLPAYCELHETRQKAELRPAWVQIRPSLRCNPTHRTDGLVILSPLPFLVQVWIADNGRDSLWAETQGRQQADSSSYKTINFTEYTSR